jgi:hypothetical protein
MTVRASYQLEWGTSAEIAAFAGLPRELVWDSSNNRIVVMMGTGAGNSWPQASVTYVDAQIANVAAGAPGMLIAQRQLLR